MCATEPGQPGFDKVTFDAVARAVRWSYETQFRDRPQERPLLGHFRDALKNHPWENAEDRAIAERVHRKLGPFTDGMYADFVNRPSTLRFDAKLLTFDLQRVSQDPVLKQLAMACISAPDSPSPSRTRWTSSLGRMKRIVLARNSSSEYP